MAINNATVYIVTPSIVTAFCITSIVLTALTLLLTVVFLFVEVFQIKPTVRPLRVSQYVFIVFLPFVYCLCYMICILYPMAEPWVLIVTTFWESGALILFGYILLWLTGKKRYQELPSANCQCTQNQVLVGLSQMIVVRPVLVLISAILVSNSFVAQSPAYKSPYIWIKLLIMVSVIIGCIFLINLKHRTRSIIGRFSADVKFIVIRLATIIPIVTNFTLSILGISGVLYTSDANYICSMIICCEGFFITFMVLFNFRLVDITEMDSSGGSLLP